MALNISSLPDQIWKSIRIPKNISLIDDKTPWTPYNLREQYSDKKRIIVLDFHVLFELENSNIEYIVGPNSEILGLKDTSKDPVIINIDHHSQHPSFNQNISTTHQTLIATNMSPDNELIPTEDDIILINHLDTDGILAMLVLTNPNMSDLIKVAFSHAAIAADHTGEFNELVTLIDAIYKNRDLELTLVTVLHYLLAKDIGKLPIYIQDKYRKELEKRELCEKIVREGDFRVIGDGIILIERQNGIDLQTISLPSLLGKYRIKCNVVIIASQKGNKYKLNVRTGMDFPKELTLQDIDNAKNLKIYGYGGRAHAGGNSRTLSTAEPITPEAFAQLIAEYLNEYNSTKSNRAIEQ